MKKVLSLCILVMLVSVACKKKAGDPQPIGEIGPPPPPVPYVSDTVKPRSYYPVYPGSWWTYRINDSVNVTDSTSKKYKLNIYIRLINKLTSPATYYYDSSYVSFYNNRPVYGYERLEHGSSYSPTPVLRLPFISEKPGACDITSKYVFCDGRYAQTGSICPTEKIRHIKKALNAQGDSMLIATGYYVNGFGGARIYPKIIVRYEYTKNIGLTFFCKVDTVSHDTLVKHRLINYYIAPH